MWKKDLEKINPKAAESLADPEEYPNLFPDLDLALEVRERGGREEEGRAVGRRKNAKKDWEKGLHRLFLKSIPTPSPPPPSAHPH